MKSLLIILLGIFPIVLTAQSVTTVSGQIVDSETGEGLLGAHVYSLRNWRNGTITGVDGSFKLSLDLSTPDSLIISFIGFKEKLVHATNKMMIELEPLETEGQVVEVTAKRLIAEEFKYMKINKIDIYTNPSAKADPILAVNSLPSSTTTDESANISLRGSSPVETSIFMNNVPVYDAVRYSQLNGIGTFSIFNTAIVRDVVVFPGNPPLEFGNTTAGVISLTTDERILEDNANSAVISLANIGFTREQKISENQSLKVFSNWQPSGAIKALNETSLESIKSFKSNDLGIYWYGSNAKVNWKVLNYSVTEGYEFNFRHPSYEGVFDQKKKRSFLISSLQIPIGQSTLSLNNALSASRGNYRYSNVKFKVDQRDFFGGINFLRENEKVSIKSGLTFDLRNSNINGNFHEYFYALAPNHPTESFFEEATVKTAEAFTYLKYYVSEKIAIGTGLRKNLPFDDQRNYLGKQVNVAYSNNAWTVTGGVGNYFKNGLRQNSGEPFTSTSKQLSVDIKYEKDRYQLAFSLFSKENELDSGMYTANGAELLIDYRFSSKLRASTSLTWLDASSNENIYRYDINYFVRGNITYSPGRFWTIEGIAIAREGVPFTPVAGANFDTALGVYEPFDSEQSSRLSGYLNVSTSISKIFPISEKINIISFASISNIFDTKNTSSFIYNFDYSEASASYFSRRTAYFGAVISF